MVRPGPRPKPTALRLLEGGHRERLNPDEPVPTAGVPSPPAEMGSAALEVWHRVVAELVTMGIASPADRDSLACLVEAVVVHRQASELLARSAVLIKGVEGGLVRNPALSVQRDAANLIRAYSSEFGLSPAARTRLVSAAPGPAEENPFAGSTT